MSKRDIVKFGTWRLGGKIFNFFGHVLIGEDRFYYNACKIVANKECIHKGTKIKDNEATIRVELRNSKLDLHGMITVADAITGTLLLMTNLNRITVSVVDVYGEERFSYGMDRESLYKLIKEASTMVIKAFGHVIEIRKTSDFPMAKGKQVDRMAKLYGLKRGRRFYGLLKETDKQLRARVLQSHVDHLNKSMLSNYYKDTVTMETLPK